jgi:diguanylate cyclase (GGDEF)-like protein
MVNILVVEDERSIARSFEETLEQEGYQTVTILSGEDAVQFALREKPHLIILDITISGIDGYKVLRRLRAHPNIIHIPIIVVGPYNSRVERVRVFEAGGDDYMAKPCYPDELRASVCRLLQRVQFCSLSPLTGLPGGLQLEHAIDNTLKSVHPWSILYLDLDNFKAYNDVYGFLAGNDMILLVSNICQQVVHEHGNVDDFVGHVGGDDFIVVTTSDRATLLSGYILKRYKQESASHYRQEDLERGSISGVDRKGRPYQFPLVSLSIGLLSRRGQRYYSVEEIGVLAAEAKRSAKQSIDNFFDISSQHSRLRQDYSPSPHISSEASYSPSRSCQVMENAHRDLLSLVEGDVFAEFK